MPNIKSLMDDIINDTEKRFTDDEAGEKFDRDEYRERLSMFVLKDIVSAMMANQTEGLDGMIDDSIMKHIHDDYKGTCFGYLCNARDKCKSPLLADVIQEIENKTAETAQECALTKNRCVAEAADVKEMLDGVDDYEGFMQKLSEEVSKKVVDDVAGLLAGATSSASAPTFSDLDEKINLKPADEVAPEANDAAATPDSSEGEADSTSAEPTEGEAAPEETNAAEETPEVKKEEDESAAADVGGDAGGDAGGEVSTESSVILTMCGNIVLESAIAGNRISTEEGLERAIVQFCLAEMDYMFKQPSTIYGKYLH